MLQRYTEGVLVFQSHQRRMRGSKNNSHFINLQKQLYKTLQKNVSCTFPQHTPHMGGLQFVCYMFVFCFADMENCRF